MQSSHVDRIGPGRLERRTPLSLRCEACDWRTTVRTSPTYHQDGPSLQDMTEEVPHMTDTVRMQLKRPTGNRPEGGLEPGREQY